MDILPTPTGIRIAYVKIQGEKDALKACSKLPPVCKSFGKANNNRADTLSGFVWEGHTLGSFAFYPPESLLYYPKPKGQRPARPRHKSSDQGLPGQASAGTFASGQGAGSAENSSFVGGDAVPGGYNNSNLPRNPIPDTNQANMTGDMHYANQGTIANYPWRGSGIYHHSEPVPLRETLHYPTVSEWYQPGGQQDMQRAAFAVDWFRFNQKSPADQFGPPPLMVPLSPVSPPPSFTYGFSNAAPMVQVYSGVLMAYPGVQSTQSVPHTAQSIHTNDDGTPINLAQGFVSVESRGVYVHNLSHDATSKDLENLFREVGHVELCEMRKESDKGRQCKAAVTFSSEGEARAAIARFDRRPFMGRILAVRLNKDFTKTQEAPTSSAKAGPSSEDAPSTRVIIANGSMGDLADDREGVPTV